MKPRREAPRRAALAAITVAATLTVAGCRTAPSAVEPGPPPGPPALFRALPPDADYYWALRRTPVLEEALEGVLPERVRRFTDRADRLYGSIRAPRPLPQLVVAGSGRFPDFLRWQLWFSSRWKRVREAPRLWANGPVQVAVPGSGTVFLGTGSLVPTMRRYAVMTEGPGGGAGIDAAVPGGRGEGAGGEAIGLGPPLPLEAEQALLRSDVFLFVANPAEGGGLAMSLPLESVWFYGTADEETVVVSAAFQLTDARGGRLVALAVRALIMQVLRGLGVENLAGRLEPVEVQPQGRIVQLEGLALRTEELARLMRPWAALTGTVSGLPEADENQQGRERSR